MTHLRWPKWLVLAGSLLFFGCRQPGAAEPAAVPTDVEIDWPDAGTLDRGPGDEAPGKQTGG